MPKSVHVEAICAGAIAVAAFSPLTAAADTVIRRTTITEEVVRPDPPEVGVFLREVPDPIEEWAVEHHHGYDTTIDTASELPSDLPPPPVDVYLEE